MEDVVEHNLNDDKAAPNFDNLEVKRSGTELVSHFVGCSANAVDNIAAWIKRKPDELPKAIMKLIDMGSYFESIKNIEHLNKYSYVDGQLSSDAVKETIIKIGPDALEYLEKSNEEYAKTLAEVLRESLKPQDTTPKAKI